MRKSYTLGEMIVLTTLFALSGFFIGAMMTQERFSDCDNPRNVEWIARCKMQK